MRNTATIHILSSSPAEFRSRFYRLDLLAKRVFDFLAAGVGLFLLAPLFALIAWQIKRDSPGPVFYRGDRLGKDGRSFKILKFRTMREEPQSYQGPRLTAFDDPRVTPFGGWLRDTKVNELPQLWNVLKGEMSLVGPRPEDPVFGETWPVAVRHEVLSIRPGITSPASVMYRDEEALLKGEQPVDTYLGEILPSKLRLDQLYVRHRSFWGDLDIIFWTLLSLAPRLSSIEVSEPSLFIGPLVRLMRRHVRWFIIDGLATLFAIGLAGLIFRILGPLHVGWGPALILAVSFSALFSLTNVILKTNHIEWSRASIIDVVDLIPGLAISTAASLLINNFLPPQWLDIPILAGNGEFVAGPANSPLGVSRSLLPNGMLLLSAGFAMAGYVLARYRSRLITGLASRWVNWRGVGRQNLERVLIIGSGDTGQFAAGVLQSGRYEHTFRVMGFVDDSMYMQDARIRGLRVLGRREDLHDLVKKLDIGIIVFAIHNISPAERLRLIEVCRRTPARVFDFPDIPEAIKQITNSGREYAVSEDDDDSELGDKLVSPGTIWDSPQELDAVLAQLELKVQSGDLEKSLEEIQNLRRQVMGDPLPEAAQSFSTE